MLDLSSDEVREICRALVQKMSEPKNARPRQAMAEQFEWNEEFARYVIQLAGEARRSQKK